MTVRGPWYLSARAVRDDLALTGRDPKDEDAFASGEDELAELVRRAHFVRTQDNGLQQWRLTGRDPKDEDAFASGEDELAELVRRAHFVRTQDNGLQQWRLTGTPRLRLLVSTRARPEGNLPQLVRLLPEHAGGRGA